MPYRKIWFPPDLYLEHKGVKVYRAYDEDGDPYEDWFTTDNRRGEEEESEFSVYELADMDSPDLSEDFDENVRKIILSAIDKGLITSPDYGDRELGYHCHDHGGVCPCCGGEEIAGGPLDVDESLVTQECSCEGCGAEWVDHYTRLGFLLESVGTCNEGEQP